MSTTSGSNTKTRSTKTIPTSVHYFRALVQSDRKNAAGADDVTRVNYSLGITTEILELDSIPLSSVVPTNQMIPAISGTAQEGEELFAWPGQWTGADTYAYQWKRDNVDIAGATGQTLYARHGGCWHGNHCRSHCYQHCWRQRSGNVRPTPDVIAA